MDNGGIEPSHHDFLQNSSTYNNDDNTLLGGSASVDSILDDIWKHTRTCTHTHLCNPPGPGDVDHTHTCYHTHTQVITSKENTRNRCETSSLKPRRPLGNREAVRKYREKKKAHTAFLEEEVKNLRLSNQHLLKKLQGQAALEAEILRLRSVLVNLRGKIDTQLDFRFQNHCSSSFDISSFKEGEYEIQSTNSKAIRLQFQTQVPCFPPQGGDKAVLSWQESCPPVIPDCEVNRNMMLGASDHPLEDVETLVSANNQCQ